MGSSLAKQSQLVAGLQAAPDEIDFLHDQNVFVTNLRCIFRGAPRIYASSGITSVGILSSSQQWGFAAICLLIAVVVAVNGSESSILLAGVFLAGAVILWVLGRPKHYLSLHTAGTHYTPLWSRSKDYVGSVEVAISNAIVARG
jgi:hypothetical protein